MDKQGAKREGQRGRQMGGQMGGQMGTIQDQPWLKSGQLGPYRPTWVTWHQLVVILETLN